MADIFLSYAQADAKRAKQVADAVAAKGWSVWWDATLVPGTRFRDEIEKQLHAARCVVVLWSKTSVKSDWVIDEADDGKKRGVLIQALIEDVRPPHGFRQIQFATLTGWDGSDSGEFTRLCGGISAYAPLSRSSRDVLSTDARQPDAPRRVQTAPAPDCEYAISRSSVLISALGGSRAVKVSTAKGCAWTATSNASWIALTSGASGTGDGSVAFNVAANTGVARSGTLTIAGHSITVQQAPASAEAGRATPEQWKDLERRFKLLNKPTLRAVLSLRTSSETQEEKWDIQGRSKTTTRDFSVLAERAGTLLAKSPRTWAKIEGTDVSDPRNPVHRWFYFLKWIGAVVTKEHTFKLGSTGIRISEIDNVAKASANACAECAANESIL